MKRTTFSTKGNAKRHRGSGRRVYKVSKGYRVSPECPRAEAKRRELIKGRTKTRPAVKRSKKEIFRLTVVWPDNIAPF